LLFQEEQNLRDETGRTIQTENWNDLDNDWTDEERAVAEGIEEEVKELSAFEQALIKHNKKEEQ